MKNKDAMRELSLCLVLLESVQRKFGMIFQNPCPAIQPQVGSDNYLRVKDKLEYAHILMRGIYAVLQHEVSKNVAQG